MKVLIGIPTYNGAPTLEATFQSLYRAVTYANAKLDLNFKIVFMPNGCTDNTEEIVQRIAKLDYSAAHIRVIDMKRPSKVVAINRLFKMHADIIGYIDDDVEFDVSAVFKAIRKILVDDNVWAVYVDSFPKSANREVGWWGQLIYNAMSMRTKFGLLLQKSNILIGRCVFIKKEKFPIIPEGIINEDQYIDYKLFPHVAKIDSAYVYYEGIYSLYNYFLRDIRITTGRRQMKVWFKKARMQQVDIERSKVIDFKKLYILGWKGILFYIVYRVVYKISKLFVEIYLFFNKNPKWKRTFPTV